MAQSPQVATVLAYIEKLDKGDVDGAHEHVTEDFLYSVGPRSMATVVGHAASNLNKAQYKSFHAKLSENFRDFDTIVENVKESPGKVIVTAKTKFQKTSGGDASTMAAIAGESPFTGEFVLAGNKIRKVIMVSEPSFAAEATRNSFYSPSVF